MEFAEIVADYGLEPWGEDWRRTAYLASALAVQKSGQSIKDYKTLIPRQFNFTLIVDQNQVDAENVFRRLTDGGRR